MTGLDLFKLFPARRSEIPRETRSPGGITRSEMIARRTRTRASGPEGKVPAPPSGYGPEGKVPASPKRATKPHEVTKQEMITRRTRYSRMRSRQ